MPTPTDLGGRIPPDAKIFVAGHGGLAGGAIWRLLQARGHSNVVGRRSRELDLRDRDATFAFFRAERPEYVIAAAARAGGIVANSTKPAELLSDNLRIQINLLDAAHDADVERFVYLGSSRAYPQDAPQPISESELLTGPLEPNLEAYGIGKIAGVVHVQALRKQFGRRYISAMLPNLFGPGDNFAIPGAHVVPMLLRRMHEARERGDEQFVVYGTGRPRRELLYSDDLAEACLVLLERYDDAAPINVGTGSETSIDDLVRLIADVVGYEGEFVHDTTKPDGAMSKLLDSSRINALGWRPRVSLREAIARTYEWFLRHQDDLRR